MHDSFRKMQDKKFVALMFSLSSFSQLPMTKCLTSEATYKLCFRGLAVYKVDPIAHKQRQCKSIQIHKGHISEELSTSFYLKQEITKQTSSDSNKGVLDSIELRMLRRADYVRDCKIFGGYMFEATVRCHYPALSRVSGWAHSLLFLAFTARWNPKHSSYCKHSVVL